MAKGLITGERPKVETPIFHPNVCVVCQWSNEAGAEYCFNCHHRLEIKEIAQEENRISALETQLGQMQQALQSVIQTNMEQDVNKLGVSGIVRSIQQRKRFKPKEAKKTGA